MISVPPTVELDITTGPVKRRSSSPPVTAGVRSADWNIRRFHVVPTGLPISQLQCKDAWNLLTENQRHFVHHFGRAVWSGSRICAHQLSTESSDILRILLMLFSSTNLQDLKTRSTAEGVMPKEWDFFLAYATCFLTCLGNFLSFGDFKFVPGISENKLDIVVQVCPLQGERKQRLISLWQKTRRSIYSLLPGERTLGLPPRGCTTYYSEDITPEDIEIVSEWMAEERIEPWNTRIWRKQSSGDYGTLPEYDLRIASSLEFPTKTHVFQSKCVIHVVHGDFKEDLEEVAGHLKDALPYAETDVQRQMLYCFVEYIETGSIESHKKCQEIWLSNQNDVIIEFHLGFIETYRDPRGCRAEFEGFVAIVNKDATEQYAILKEKADTVLLPLLPWPKDYEADKFLCPAFSCLEVLFYGNGNIPAGINLPNYERVRQRYGSRNFCLSNVVEAHENRTSKITFLTEQDNELSKGTILETVFVVQLAFHELLGHGSGKLFTHDGGGDYNFSHGTVMHPFTNEAVTTCYEPGETWNSMFGKISSAFEECRAECVGIFLSTFPQALEVFGHVGQHAEDIMYVNWLLMARAGLLALEYVSSDSGHWSQAHMQARFGILRTLLTASALEEKENTDRGVKSGSNFLEILPRGHNNVELHLNRDKIRTVGLPAVRDLLMKLQVYRSTADVRRGRKLFEDLTTVPEDLRMFRKAIFANKKPRSMLVQINTKLVEDDEGSRIQMEEFEPTAEGLIQSYIVRFKDWIVTC